MQCSKVEVRENGGSPSITYPVLTAGLAGRLAGLRLFDRRRLIDRRRLLCNALLGSLRALQ
eukprot:4099208-Prymnesium_polylepis.2